MPENKRYGYFDNKAREFVITRPDTPMPWINYLGCQDYLGIISNTAAVIAFIVTRVCVACFDITTSPLTSPGWSKFSNPC